MKIPKDLLSLSIEALIQIIYVQQAQLEAFEAEFARLKKSLPSQK